MPDTAEATTITRVSLRAAAARSATPRIRSALLTLVPPNFITLMSGPPPWRAEGRDGWSGVVVCGEGCMSELLRHVKTKKPRARERGAELETRCFRG